MAQRALLFPSYRGGGFGHVSRCLVLAEELTSQGWEVAFVLGGPHADRVAAAGWPVFRPPSPSLPTRLRRRVGRILGRFRSDPAYLFFSDLNFQAVRDGFRAPQVVQQEVERELDIVSRFRPDLLIGDAWLLTHIVGRLAELPVVQIIRSAAHPACPQLVWWRDVPPVIRSPDVTPVFNPVLEQWALPSIQRAEDLLDGDLLLIPSIPELDPLPPDVERSHYVGPLTRSGRAHQRVPDWLAALPRDRPIVYVTVGGGSNAVRGQDLLPLWETAFAETDWTVIVSTGGRPVSPHRQRIGNLQVFPWVPGAAMIDRADVVLFHGGYGTMMETVRFGTPAVVLPFHTEQEGNGRRLEQCGAARILAPADDDLTPVTYRWEQGDFTTLVCRQLSFRPEEVHQVVRMVLRDNSYRKGAERLRRSQATFTSEIAVGEIVKSLVSF